jgi:hypothetical protein
MFDLAGCRNAEPLLRTFMSFLLRHRINLSKQAIGRSAFFGKPRILETIGVVR